MNEPIISPWVIYFASVASSLKTVSCLVGAISAFLVIFPPFWDVLDEAGFKHKYLSIICGVSVLLFILMPSQEVIYKMVVTQQITPANLQYGEEKIFKLIDKCADIIVRKEERK